MKDTTKTIFICILAEAGNFIFAYIFLDTLHIPLFFDTIFTVAVAFYCGLIPSLTVALLYNVIATFTQPIRGFAFDPHSMLFGISGALIAASTWFFARRKEEFKISTTITILYLILIAVVSSFCSIISSGLIDFIRFSPESMQETTQPRFAPIKDFTDSFVDQRFSLLASCFLGQIPSSITDRVITTFAGFGVYKLMVRIFGEEQW